MAYIDFVSELHKATKRDYIGPKDIGCGMWNGSFVIRIDTSSARSNCNRY